MTRPDDLLAIIDEALETNAPIVKDAYSFIPTEHQAKIRELVRKDPQCAKTS